MHLRLRINTDFDIKKELKIWFKWYFLVRPGRPYARHYNNVDIVSQDGFVLYRIVFDSWYRTKGLDSGATLILRDRRNREVYVIREEHHHPIIGGIETRSGIPEICWVIYEKKRIIGKIIQIKNGKKVLEINNFPVLTLTKLDNFWITGAKLMSGDDTVLTIKDIEKDNRDCIIDCKSNQYDHPSMTAALSTIYSVYISGV